MLQGRPPRRGSPISATGSLDAQFPPIGDAASLAAALDAIPGVVEHGLFVGMASLVLVGGTPVVRRAPP